MTSSIKPRRGASTPPPPISAAPTALKAVTVPNVVAYEIYVRTQAGASYAVPQLDAPGITATGTSVPQTIGLSSDQPGAAIYFTLDGSQPAPRGPTAMLYSAPFVVSEPCLLRARAWLAGYTASDEARMTFG